MLRPLLLILSVVASAAAAQDVSTERRDQLLSLVHQDCGSCHGMRLTGGLGPPLTSEALQGRSRHDLRATIRAGRPGTPMPPWKALLSEADIEWIVEYLKTSGGSP
ncbi:MAG: cytochrome c [Gammaproteobacteria bacterium]|jgi:cytochrome c55X